MKAILTAALVFGLCNIAVADDKADPVGSWKCEYTVGMMKRESTLSIKKVGDKLVGTMDWPDQKEAKLKDVAFKDGELTFTAERELKDMKLVIKYKLKVEKDTIKGKGEVEIGNEKRDFEIEGRREKK
ncbi:DUF2147 domain-containing protein [Zavarzinella formosa]|uniref:hypothetical protein n=1 Tax=Zavarzinella formosa TaxID=360055 RepID=UPI00031AEECC|nr:hypothetical protein [Zavarzinella formosa]